MVAKAAELARQHGWWQSRQFENPANAEVHERTTAVEILEDFADVSLDYWVTGFGTGGTLNGVSRVLRKRSPNTRIVVCEPDNSAILASGIPQARNSQGGHSESHPVFRPHLMQGWSPDFIPKLAEEVTAGQRIDRFMAINGNDALRCARELACKEGIFVGISAGATFAGALQIAAEAPEGANILCMLPDTGERYLTTPLFEDVAVEMTEEEMDISRSTQGYRFDLSSTPPPPAEGAAPAVDEAARQEVETLLGDREQRVVMFALEWCEFCWSVRKVLAKYQIPYRSVDLDSVAYQDDNRGGKIREALRAKTGWNTFPQIFIGGEFIGGCTDLFDSLKEGSLAEQLQRHEVPFDAGVKDDPYSFLPGWLHPR
jgi:cysteine synthase A